MFTVIACNRHIKEDCRKHNSYLRPLLENDNFAFCDWDSEADSLDAAVPALKGLIRDRNAWNLILVCDSKSYGMDNINRKNPFDYVDYVKVPTRFSDIDELSKFHESKAQKYQEALNNPILKLTNWLLGIAIPEKPTMPEEYLNLPAIDDEYLAKLDAMNLNAVDIELAKLRQEKYALLTERFSDNGNIFNKPKAVYVVSERMFNGDYKKSTKIDQKFDEFRYSRFCEDNLYHPKLRYILFDIEYIMSNRNRSQYFEFLTLILLLAVGEIPYQALRPYFVYHISAKCDTTSLEATCAEYVAKLQATNKKINAAIYHEKKKSEQVRYLDDATSEEVFESDVKVPVNVNAKYGRDEFDAKYSSIGLSKDCPTDEEVYWNEQYFTIKKKFIRFLREPRRAVKTALDTDFRLKNKIDDNRALMMTPNQKEDVQYRLEEEESEMVKMHIENVFDSSGYIEEMDKADKEVKRGIAQRMTRKKTLIIGVIVVVMFLFGMLPLIFSNLNNAKSRSFALVFVAVALGIFCVTCVVDLFVLRHRLINRFKHFNYVVSGIMNQINTAMELVSQYLGHACNVLREFSVFDYIKNHDTEGSELMKIYRHHLNDVNQKLEDVTDIFGAYLNKEAIARASDASPYPYDFTVYARYNYDMPCHDEQHTIEFLQNGNEISVPIDYVKSVALEREELYD